VSFTKGNAKAMRRKILFVAESVTLAQVVRLVALARTLDESAYDVHFASAIFPEFVFAGTTFARHHLPSVSSAHIAQRLRSGRRLYDVDVLRRYVRDDLKLFRATEPDVVVGDFRLSLAISAPHWGVPHVALANAYWSPHAVRRAFPLPDHPVVRLLGEERAAKHFMKALPYVFDHFARPVNVLRKVYGLSPLGSLPEVLTHGDFVLYGDTPSLVPTRGAPTNHEYIGPVTWSAVHAPLPSPRFDSARPCVYVTLGSSGDVAVLPKVIEALAPLPITALVATAGRTAVARPPANVWVAEFLPGDWAARRSALVISNGGSSTGYQSLAEGTPVLGIASNLDQFLAMTSIVDAGAGSLVRASTATVPSIRGAVTAMLATESYRDGARAVQREFGRWPFARRFAAAIARIVGGQAAAGAMNSENGAARARSKVPNALAAALIIGVAAFAGSARAEGSSSVPSTNEIRFSADVDGTKGHVICALFRKEGWLKKPIQWKKVAIRGGEAECVFSSVAPDVYGVSAFHDENDNERLDTNFIGIPTESWCTSRDAKAFFGPPSFDAAKFRYTGGVMRQRSSLK
jgi:UDP:flavonoid glycosyltransferase YjiC (YdhE family)/uncharacterized protein (DUF2141 family)